MEIPQTHPWVQTVAEARLIQNQLRSQVITTDKISTVNYVAGVDVGFKDNYRTTQAAVVVLGFPQLQVVEKAVSQCPTTFPYIPGFLSFREIPALLQALAKIKITPDLILCDGQGLAHPRRFGLACHLGVLLDLPTIGVAKSLFVGEHEAVGREKGSWQPLQYEGDTIGAVVRSRTDVKPIYVSIGHRLSLATAIDYVLHCTPKYRLPETTRQADKLASS